MEIIPGKKTLLVPFFTIHELRIERLMYHEFPSFLSLQMDSLRNPRSTVSPTNRKRGAFLKKALAFLLVTGMLEKVPTSWII